MKDRAEMNAANSGGPNRRRSAAFTLVEILIAVTLMSVIVLGLMAMFTQTQRAFRLGMNQVDVLEAGRIAVDMLVREVEQTAASGKHVSFAGGSPSTTRTTPGFYAELMSYDNAGYQLLPGGGYRTNYMSDLFFLTQQNQLWTGIGYFVRTNARVASSYGPVGTLYRFQTNRMAWSYNASSNGFWSGFNAARFGSTNVSKVLDGVVHFSVRAFDERGNLIARPPNFEAGSGAEYWWTNAPGSIRADYPLAGMPNEVSRYFFCSNAIPAYVELEIGILEDQTYERYQGIMNSQLKQNFYIEHAGNVHLFRQRIPVRRANSSVFQ